MEKTHGWEYGEKKEWTIWLFAINNIWIMAKRFKGQLALWKKMNESIGKNEDRTIWLSHKHKWIIAERFKGQLAELRNNKCCVKGILKGGKSKGKSKTKLKPISHRLLG